MRKRQRCCLFLFWLAAIIRQHHVRLAHDGYALQHAPNYQYNELAQAAIIEKAQW